MGIGKGFKESGSGLFQSNIPTFSWRVGGNDA